MKLTADNLRKHIPSFAKELNDFTEPLEKIGIVGFNFSENFGKYTTVLTTNPEYVIAAVERNLHRDWMSLKRPEKFADSYFALSSHYSDFETVEIQKKYNYERNGVVKIERIGSIVRMYFFQCSEKREDYLIKNHDIIREFISLFHETKSGLLNRVRSCKYELDHFVKLSIDPKLGKNTTSKLRKTRELSSQQKKCIQLLKKGQNVKEISHTIGVNQSTIYYYLKTLKKETNSNSILELISQF